MSILLSKVFLNSAKFFIPKNIVKISLSTDVSWTCFTFNVFNNQIIFIM